MVQKGKINVKERFSDGEVDLSMSDLDDVPVKEIVALKKTTSLDLSNNRLTFIPPTFTVLTNLTKLDLSKNELSELPEDFGKLSKLKHLDLYKNKLERLPLSFGQLSGLKFLDLKDNPLIPTIAKVAGPCVDNKGCQQCAKDIVNFYRKLQEEVDNEVEMRKKARQKQLEINQQKKQEEKNKLKKEKQNNKLKRDAHTDHKNSTNISKKPSKKDQKKNKNVQKTKDLGSSFFLYFTWCVILFLTLWFLTAFKFPIVQPYILLSNRYYQIFLDKLPPNYKHYGEVLGTTVSFLQESTRNVTINCIKVLNNNEVLQGVILKVTECFSGLIEKVSGKNK